MEFEYTIFIFKFIINQKIRFNIYLFMFMYILHAAALSESKYVEMD